jgi:hypothetical protein
MRFYLNDKLRFNRANQKSLIEKKKENEKKRKSYQISYIKMKVCMCVCVCVCMSGGLPPDLHNPSPHNLAWAPHFTLA